MSNTSVELSGTTLTIEIKGQKTLAFDLSVFSSRDLRLLARQALSTQVSNRWSTKKGTDAQRGERAYALALERSKGSLAAVGPDKAAEGIKKLIAGLIGLPAETQLTVLDAWKEKGLLEPESYSSALTELGIPS